MRLSAARARSSAAWRPAFRFRHPHLRSLDLLGRLTLDFMGMRFRLLETLLSGPQPLHRLHGDLLGALLGSGRALLGGAQKSGGLIDEIEALGPCRVRGLRLVARRRWDERHDIGTERGREGGDIH